MKPLKRIEKIQLINELVTLINSGITPSHAVKVLMESDAKAAFLFTKTARHLKIGRSFSASLAQSELMNRFELSLLKISEESGQLSLGLSDIQKRLEKRHRHLKSLKQKCYLPLGALIIAILATTILSFVRNSPSQALFQLLTGTAYLLIVCFFIKVFITLCENASEFSFRIFWRQPMLKPIKLIRNVVEYNIYHNLSLQLKSGIDAHQAVKALEIFCNKPNYLKSLANCQRLISAGSDLTSALSQSNLIFSNDLYQFLYTSEKSGTLDTGLTSYLAIKESEIEEQIDTLIQWFPRIFYIFVIFIALSLF